MWRRRFSPYLLTLVFLIVPAFALAQGSWITPESTGLSQAAEGTGLINACQGDSKLCVAVLVGNVIRFALGFVEVLLFLYLLWGGFLWMTSGGDEKGVEKAKTMIKNAVIGLFIITVSYVASSYVISNLASAVSA